MIVDSPASAQSAEVSEDLALQALDNLVNQFARPLDCLRELVQNAIDAGTPRVEIWFRFQPSQSGGDQGALEVHIDDFGEGMDERIIDGQLTRMFASNKEDDLTKIGKFGIGFTSIFAIQPDAVLLQTGRHNEFWELLFHPDRSFEKVRVDVPVYGTKITLLKPMARSDVHDFVQRCRMTLQYWLEHSDIPVLFAGPDLDWSRSETDLEPLAANPFASFGAEKSTAGRNGRQAFEQLNSPLGMEEELQIRIDEPDLHGFVGYTDRPFHAFYNRGLTLIRSTSSDVLGEHAHALGHFAFKLKGRHLEHTLTRDNVLRDTAWHHAMTTVSAAVWELRPLLLARISRETVPGGNPDPWLWHLATDCLRTASHRQVDGFARDLVLPQAHGEPTRLRDVLIQSRRLGHILVAGDHEALDAALLEDGKIVLANRPAVRALLRAIWNPVWMQVALLETLEAMGVGAPRFLRREQAIVETHQLFAMPELLPYEELPADERALASAANQLLKRAESSFQLRIGDFGGARVESDLALEGPQEGGVFLRVRESRWPRWPWRSRYLLLNRHHEVVRAQTVVAGRQPVVAAYGLLLVLFNSPEDADLIDSLMRAASEMVLV